MEKYLKYYFIFLFCLFPLHISAKVIEVCKNCSIKTIKEGIDKANPCDTVYVKKGIYKEREIIITKPVVLKAEEGAVIDGEEKGEILIINSNHVIIDGFTVVNVGTSYIKDFAAIRVREARYFEIKNNTIKNLFFGIYLEKSSQGKVINNKIYGKAVSEFNSGNGIQLWKSDKIIIQNNYVEKVRDGIYLEFSSYCRIQNNKSINNVRYGLHFMFSHSNLVQNDWYQNNGAGVAIMFSKKMEMLNNFFIRNWGTASYGVLLKEVNDSKLEKNTFKENTIAINVEGANNIKYLNNDFISNGWAINSRGANYQNYINYNNFLNNSFDIVNDGAVNNNNFDSNYWSNYSGYDLDRNGIGDVPYQPVKLFSYIVHKVPEAVIFLRSLFVDIVDFSEKVSPVFTPDNLVDNFPKMKKIKHDSN